MDEPEDRKEEDEEDADEDKATVDVIKPVPEPEEEAPKTETAGQIKASCRRFITFTFAVTWMWYFVISECPCMHSGKAKESVTKTAEKKGLRIYRITSLF